MSINETAFERDGRGAWDRFFGRRRRWSGAFAVMRKTLAVLLIASATLAACGAPRYHRSSEQTLVESLLFGVNAKERKMADGIYQLTVGDGRDRHEIPPTKLMMFFAAELTREKGYETFVILPSDEKPYEPREVKKIRARVLSGEFNEFMRKAPIKVKTRTVCSNYGCSASYTSRAIIVMLKGDERKKALSYHAERTYKKLKPEIPEQGNVLRRERNRARCVRSVDYSPQLTSSQKPPVCPDPSPCYSRRRYDVVAAVQGREWGTS